MAHAGLDTDQFPGLDAMARLYGATNLGWCGFYLAPAPSHRDTGWMARRAALKAQGWGFAPVFLGQEVTGPGSHNVTAEQGAIDGVTASSLMAKAGFPSDSYVYLDLEAPNPETAYLVAWAKGLQGFRPGVYCSHLIADRVAKLLGDAGFPHARIWAYKVTTGEYGPFDGTTMPTDDPGQSGYPQAYIWQQIDNARLTAFGGLPADLDTALSTDPSAP